MKVLLIVCSNDNLKPYCPKAIARRGVEEDEVNNPPVTIHLSHFMALMLSTLIESICPSDINFIS